MRTIESAVITGPTGAIGVSLCKLLVTLGLTVYAVVNPTSQRKQSVESINGLHVINCDASGLAILPTIIPHADAFFHLAWAKTVGEGRNNMPAQIDNIQWTIDACRVAGSLGCIVFVGAGSQAEYGRVDSVLTAQTPCFPENGYGMAKLCAGQMSRVECNRLGIDHIWPRILSIYGPYDGNESMIMSVIPKLLRGEVPALTAGEQEWDYLYSQDAAEALYAMACFGKAGSIYPLGCGVARPLKTYLEIMRDTIDPSLSLGLGQIPYSSDQVMRLQADTSALQRDTGFIPKVDFADGIARTIDYVREHSSESE